MYLNQWPIKFESSLENEPRVVHTNAMLLLEIANESMFNFYTARLLTFCKTIQKQKRRLGKGEQKIGPISIKFHFDRIYRQGQWEKWNNVGKIRFITDPTLLTGQKVYNNNNNIKQYRAAFTKKEKKNSRQPQPNNKYNTNEVDYSFLWQTEKKYTHSS